MIEPAWLVEARRHIGTKEIPGAKHEPKILAWWKAIKRGVVLALVFLEWLRYRIFRCHAVRGEPLVERACVYAKSRLSRFKGEFFAKRRELERVALVVVLIFAGGPAAIIERVAKIVALSVERVFVAWPWPHVFKKALESCFRAIANKPAVADGNAAPAIPAVATPFLVVAAAFHVAPNPLLRFVGTAMLRVGGLCRRRHSDLANTSAVSGFPASEIVGVHKPNGPALTAARRFASNRVAGDCPFSEFVHSMTWFVGIKELCHE